MLLAATVALTFTACGDESSQVDAQDSANSTDITLYVHAAASLQHSFEELSEAFTAKYPHVTISFNFAGSSTLVQNLAAGAPADVFASADDSNMDKAEQADLLAAETRELFAANRLIGVVPADNPAGIESLEDANADGVNLVVCAPQVPCGALSQTLAEDAGVTLKPVSEEQQVSDVLGKVRSGQADVGLVYATDAALVPDEVDTFTLDGAEAHLNEYPVARAANSEHPEVAGDFIEFIQSGAGQDILDAHGFLTLSDVRAS